MSLRPPYIFLNSARSDSASAIFISCKMPVRRLNLIHQVHLGQSYRDRPCAYSIIPFRLSLSDRVGEALQLFTEARGLGFIAMLNGIFKQQIQPLDFLNHIVSLWHRHLLSPILSAGSPAYMRSLILAFPLACPLLPSALKLEHTPLHHHLTSYHHILQIGDSSHSAHFSNYQQDFEPAVLILCPTSQQCTFASSIVCMPFSFPVPIY